MTMTLTIADTGFYLTFKMTPDTSLSQFMGAVRNEAAVARAEGLEMEVLAQFDQSVSVWVREGASLGQLFTWMESPVRIVFLGVPSAYSCFLAWSVVPCIVHVGLLRAWLTCMESRTCAYDACCDIQHLYGVAHLCI
jgi:hypothetical protein